MVEVKIDSIRVSLMTTTQVIILKDVNAERYLPVFVAKPEGDAITLHLREEAPNRPMTHDLVVNIAEALDAQLVRVMISEVRNNHFFAQLVFQSDNQEHSIDVRSSDAIAVAIRAACPIFVDDEVMEQVGVMHNENDSDDEENAPQDGNFGAFEDFLDSLDLKLGDQDQDKPK